MRVLDRLVQWQIGIGNEKVGRRAGRRIAGQRLVGRTQHTIHSIVRDIHGNRRVVASMECPNRLIEQMRRDKVGRRGNARDRQRGRKLVRISADHVPSAATAVREARHIQTMLVDVLRRFGLADHRHYIGREHRTAPVVGRLRRVEKRAAPLGLGQQVVDVDVDLARVVGAVFAGPVEKQDERPRHRRVARPPAAHTAGPAESPGCCHCAAKNR